MPGTGLAFHEEPIDLRGVSTLRSELSAKLQSWYATRLETVLPDKFEDLKMEDYLFACWKHKNGQGELSELATKFELDASFLDNWWRFLSTDTSNPYLKRIHSPWAELPGPDQIEAVKSGIAKIVAEQEIAMNNSELESSVRLKEGEDRFYLIVADMGDGNRGDYVLWKELKIGFGKDENGKEHREPLFTWIADKISELEKQIAEGKSDTKDIKEQLAKLRAIQKLNGTFPEGFEPGEVGFAVQAPSQIEICLPSEVKSLAASPGLIQEHPDTAYASVQTMIYGGDSGGPPELLPLLPAIRPKFAKSSKVSADFYRAAKIKSRAFPRSRDVPIGRNQLSSGKGKGAVGNLLPFISAAR